jgi:hypothetical protein
MLVEPMTPTLPMSVDAVGTAAKPTRGSEQATGSKNDFIAFSDRCHDVESDGATEERSNPLLPLCEPHIRVGSMAASSRTQLFFFERCTAARDCNGD